MSKLKFKIQDVRKLLSNLKDDDVLSLGGDQGVYIMSFAEEVGKRTIVYAEGIDPVKNEDTWWETKAHLYGGDDGGDDFGTKRELQKIVDQCSKWFIINLTATSLSCTSDYRRPPRQKTIKIDVNALPAGLLDELGIKY